MKNSKTDKTHKLLRIINRYTIGLLIIICLSFFIEKKFFINEPTKKIRILISTLLFFSSYVFILKNFKIEFNKKKKFNIRIFIRDNLTNIKYLFAILIPILNTIWYRNIYYFYFGLIELLLIFLFTNILSSKSEKLGYIFNGILILLYVINEFILFFGTTFLSYIMLSNLDSIDLIMSKAFIYIPALIIGIIFSFIPIKTKKIENINLITYLTFFIYILLISNFQYFSSPLMSYAGLASDIYDNYRFQNEINNYRKSDYKSDYYQKNVSNYTKYNKSVGENPNVILIFVEGLSQSIVTDSRNIMPNTKKLMYESLVFDNYYNHTQATYRGLIGQLYSGYQNYNLDNNELISLQSIFEKNGYNTSFINVEPYNKEFSDYLESMNFMNLVNKYDKDKGSLSDKEAYESLYNEAIRLNEENKPFFLSMYSFGTHATFDSKDKKFGNGGNPELNKFYDFDYQFGLFFEKFKSSKLYDNTIIVFTTDHATYVDNDYYNTFKGNSRANAFLDKIPLYIYHKNVEVKTLDAKYKNSLDLAPTIIDYIDKENNENYFLGDSLFAKDEGKSKYDNINYSEGTIIINDNGSFRVTSVKENKEIKEGILKYFSVSSKKK